ncbi:MAG: ATP-binding protein [Verrucomicrobiota bacterium]
MRCLLDLPLRRKLLVLVMASSTLALLLAAGSFSVYEWFILRDTARRDVQTQAEILAANVSAAVEFGDADHARRILRVLQMRPQFDLACVFDENRRLLAGYTNEFNPEPVRWLNPIPQGVQSEAGHLVVFQPVMHDNHVAGTLYLRSEFSPIRARFGQYLGLAMLVLLACWWIAFGLAARLQRIVSQPILELARTARDVTERKDYSLRAVSQSHDEVGLLIEGFNEMLTQIQARDVALQKTQDDLERRVTERTSQLQDEIVQRRRIEAALADEKERLAVTLRSIGDAVVATDREGCIVLFNPVAEQLTGWGAAEAATRPLPEVLQLFHDKTRQPCENPVTRVLASGGPVEPSEGTLLVSRDGTQRLIASSSAPIRDRAGQIIGVVLVFRDVTEKERTTQELLKASKLESIGLLAGGIAHDFNNILTAILGNISLARLIAQPQDELAEALLHAEKAAARAGDLTRQLLTFSKGGSPMKQSASLAEIIKETTAFVLHGSNVGLQLELATDLWPASIDVGQISQVIHNLVLNGIQAMPKGGTLDVRAANVSIPEHHGTVLRPGRYISITIQDTGTGIAPEHCQRIFDPYFTTKKQGSGLGLATTYSIIRKHEGNITVQSELGRGTTFQIHLPASSTPTVAPAEPPPEPLAGQGRILIMDDEEPIRSLVIRMLQPLGYEVKAAADGAEALRIYEEARAAHQPISVVILDLTVPGGMGGLEALQRLRALDPHLKAIVSSGYSEDPVMAHHREHGFDAMVTKPYRLQEFTHTLQEVLKQVKV